jgi:type IX secretion system PorP/SprF family membrane protein
MKIRFAILLSTLFCCTIHAQQQPTYFHSPTNPYLINPAYVGEAEGQNLYLIGRNDFLDMPNAPKSYHLSFDAALSNPRIGFGAEAYSNSTFAIKNLGFSASYRYKFQVAERHLLSTAVSAGFVQNSLDFSKIIANDPSEISDFIGAESAMRPNFHVGFLYQFAGLKIGVSAFHTLAPTFTYEKSLNQQDLAYRFLQQYHASIAYRHRFGNRWAVDMMALGGSTHGLPMWGTFNATLNYDDVVWFGGGYGYQSMSYFTVGVRLAEQLVCSYAYGFSTQHYRKQLGASHEICIGYRIQRRPSGSSRDQRLSQELTQLQYIVEHQGEEIDRLKQERLELRNQINQYLLTREMIDSLLQQNALLAESVANQHVQQIEPDVPDVVEDTAFEDCFYVVVGATKTVADAKTYQRLILKNFGIDTKVLDPEPLQSYFFIYTDVFTNQRDALRVIEQLEQTDIGEYIIGNVWIHRSKRKVTIEND